VRVGVIVSVGVAGIAVAVGTVVGAVVGSGDVGGGLGVSYFTG